MEERTRWENKEEELRKKALPDLASCAGSLPRANDLSGLARRGHTDACARTELEKEDKVVFSEFATNVLRFPPKPGGYGMERKVVNLHRRP